MQYRKWNKTGADISLLGFGAMRLPMLSDGQVDEPESIRMIRHAIDSGVNYVDTAYMYHDGMSEVIVGKALKDGYREKVFLADKIPLWMADAGYEGMQKLFDTQMKRLDMDSVDMYLIHAIDDDRWQMIQERETLRFLEELRASGRIKYIGFSYHGSAEFFNKVVDAYDWDFCQIQLNYMDANIQAGVAGLKYAGSKGISVVIMEPLKGGKITQNVPPQIQSIWDSAPAKCSPAEWALKWVANFPEVTTILSGMSNMEQLDENLEITSRLTAESLTGEEIRAIENVAEKYNALIRYGCTSCGYCLKDCPKKIAIPEIIGIVNDVALYDSKGAARSEMSFQNAKPSECISCGVCEALCPQHLPIPEIMAESAKAYE